jgi:hypothetical protein
MAITIMGGLFVATILTLLVVPALYALWFGVHDTEPATSELSEELAPLSSFRIAAE